MDILDILGQLIYVITTKPYIIVPIFVGVTIFTFILIKRVLFSLEDLMAEKQQCSRSIRSEQEFFQKYKISIAHPKLLSKRYTSRFLIQIYLPEVRDRVLQIVESTFKNVKEQNTIEHIQDSELKIDQIVRLKLSSPEIIFSDPVIKRLDRSINITNFTAKPKDGCYPGMHPVILSISDAATGIEYQSISFTVQIVDFAFDHISRPLLSKVFSIAAGTGSLVMFILTLLGQIDTALGLVAGTTASILASAIYGKFISLYQQPKVTHTP